MATTVARLEAILGADTDQFDRAMNKSEGRMSKMGKAAALGGLAIAGGIAVGMKKSVDAALEAEKAEARLTSAMDQVGVSAKNRAAANEAISKTSKLAALDDEDLSDVYAKLIRTTGDVQKSTEGMNLAADIARSRNISLEAAAKAVEKAYVGSAAGLKKFGVETIQSTSNMDFLKTKIDEQKASMKGLSGAQLENAKIQLNNLEAQKDVAKQQDKMASGLATLKEAQDQFAGSAEAYGKTSAGAQERFQVAVENLEEAIGKKLLPILAKLAEMALQVIESIERNWPKIMKVIGPVMDDVREKIQAVTEAVQKIWEEHGKQIIATVTTVFGFLQRTIENAMKVIQGVIDVVMGVLSGDWSRAWDGIKQIVSGVMNQIVNVLETILPLMAKAALAIGTGIKNKVVEGITGLAGAVWNLIDNIGEKIKDMMETILGWGTSVGAAVKKATIDAIVGIGLGAWNIINNVGEKIVDMASTIVGWGTSIGTKILNAVPEALKGIGGIAWNIINDIGTKINDMTDTIKGWGSSVIGKIINGLRGAASDLWDAVTGIFDKLPGFVKKILGISSPSKAFMEIGENLVAGLVKGLENKSGDLRDAAIDMAKKIAGDAWDKLSGVAGRAGSAIAGAAGAVGGAIGIGGGSDRPDGYAGKAGVVSGDIAGLASSLMTALRDMSGATGQPIWVQSGFRTFAEQVALVAQKGLWSPSNPTGAAAPGTSKHESGRAADITPGREFFGWLASRFGLQFPIPEEPWHVESYDKGGWLPPKSKTLAINNTSMWEPVGPPGRGGGGGSNVTVHVHGFVGNPRELARAIRDVIADVERTNGRRPFGGLALS